MAPHIDREHIIAIDLGTGGPKTGVVNTEGEILWARHDRIATTREPDGGARQDPTQWWSAVKAAIATARTAGIIDRTSVLAISVTGQWSSSVPVSADGDPVAPALLWMDPRGAKFVRQRIGGSVAGYRPRALATWISHSGGVPSLTGGDPIGHHQWCKQVQPDVYRAAAWMMEPVDFLTMCFTKEVAASAQSMCGSWLVDTRTAGHWRYDQRCIELADIDGTKLPPLVPFGSIVGTVHPRVADELGIAAGIPVVTGQPDLHSGAIGSGAIGIGEVHFAISTSGWISLPTVAKHTDVLRNCATVPGINDHSYLVANNHEAAGLALEWFRQTYASSASIQEVIGWSEASAPGARGVIFTPWLNGERSPVADLRARGGFLNLSTSTTRADLAQAVLEGVAFNNLWLLDAVQRFSDRRIGSARCIGGGAQSERWCQIHADVMNTEVVQIADPVMAGLRGAALLAIAAVHDTPLPELVKSVPVARTFTPNPRHRGRYEWMFGEFTSAFRRLAPLHHQLNTK